MKKILVLLFVAGTFLVADLASINAHAQRAIRCTDSDNSTRNMSGDGPDSDRFVRGRTVGYSPSQRRRVARNDRCIDDHRLVEYFCMDDRMSGGVTVSCGENEFCRDGVCVTEIPTNGRNYFVEHPGQYVLNNDLGVPDGVWGILLEYVNGPVTIDCQGHQIFSLEEEMTGTVGIDVYAMEGLFEIKNCNFVGLSSSIQAHLSNSEIRIENVNISGTAWGIILNYIGSGDATIQNVNVSAARMKGLVLDGVGWLPGRKNARVLNTTLCSNSPPEEERDHPGLFCKGVQVTGGENHFGHISYVCENGWPTPNDYSPCDEVQ